MLLGDLVSEEEIKMLVDSAVSVRNKAFIITLYESGARIGARASLDGSPQDTY